MPTMDSVLVSVRNAVTGVTYARTGISTTLTCANMPEGTGLSALQAVHIRAVLNRSPELVKRTKTLSNYFI